MTKGKQSGGMKSALELAMERMQKSEGDIVPLTDEKKAPSPDRGRGEGGSRRSRS
jgi:hypothetical protein